MPSKDPNYTKLWRLRNPNWDKEYRQRNRLKIRKAGRNKRLAILAILGNQCIKCGNKDRRVLVLDHIHGGGSKERRKWKYSTANIYNWYLKNPEIAIQKLQVLCANCNMIKGYEEKEWFKGDEL